MLSTALLSLLSGSSAYTLRVDARHVAACPRRALAVMQVPGEAPTIVSEETYGLMLKTLLETENKLEDEVSTNYALFDYGFLQKLDLATADADDVIAKRATEVKAVFNEEMVKRMQTAAETLKEIFTSPTPVIMDGKIAGLARQGKIDDALYSLLTANLEQAQAAGEAGASAVGMLTKLQDRVKQERDAVLDPSIALFRQLMRMESAEARQRLLKEKFTPKAESKIVLMMGDTEQKQEDTKPDVPPSVFAATIKDLKLRFGNVDEQYDSGFVKKLELIAEEAEAVALELAGGKEMSAKEAQDLAWNAQTVSVWDLEQVENEAHQDGNFAMWEKEAQEQMARQESDSRLSGLEKDGLM